ncbi:MAG: lipopolysaccharide assembly protein LapB [Pseudomonadales bacterium]|nr:lipopolysaccharide assembly protein LapB [Pseudomonadales bacterium]
MDSLLIYLLLLLAVIAGWLMGRLTARSKTVKPRNTQTIFQDYFVGLNYLLNDEPDEAIDTFIKALEINSDTIETHLALGALLRRRGKVDKAIKVHQTLLARQGLDKSFFDSTRLQLAMDYISAGLLDRAERLLKEIQDEGGEARWEALKHLVTIYQTEKEWELALNSVEALLRNSAYKKDTELRSIAAHYCCELAEDLLRQNQLNRARDQIRRAFTFDRKHVRASLLLAKLEQRLGNTATAVKELIRVRTNYPDFSSYVLELLSEWHRGADQEEELETLLAEQLATSPDAFLLQHLAQFIHNKRGNAAAMEFLESHYDKHPSLEGMVSLLSLHMAEAEGSVNEDLSRIKDRLAAILQKQYSYQCNHCGYESRNLYWLCPSCQRWDKTGPITQDMA